MTVTADSSAEPADSAAERAADRVGSRVDVGRASALYVLIAGVLGLAAALTLTIEKIEILINPDYVPSCSINPVLSCGSVMITPQASAFGFPNPLIGIVSFSIVNKTLSQRRESAKTQSVRITNSTHQLGELANDLCVFAPSRELHFSSLHSLYSMLSVNA